MAGYHLGDMWGQAVHDGVGDEHPPEVVRRVMQRPAVGEVNQAGVHKSGGEQLADSAGRDRPVLRADTALEQQRRWPRPHPLMHVVGGHQRDLARAGADPQDDGAKHFGQLRADHQEAFGISLGRGHL